MKLSAKPPRSPAERLRRYEEGVRRRRRRLSCPVQIKIDDAKIEALVKRGYLMPNERDDDSAIEQAASLFLWDLLAKEEVPSSSKRSAK